VFRQVARRGRWSLRRIIWWVRRRLLVRCQRYEEVVMNDPSKVRVTGPLAGYVGGFRRELEARGYRPGTVANQLWLVAELSRWLDVQGLAVGDLTAERVEQFFSMRRARVQVLHISRGALRALLDHLDGVGVLPAPEPVKRTPLALLLDRYHRHLL
jgi:integrase/recombinase XerD